jgi:hypothetical protein
VATTTLLTAALMGSDLAPVTVAAAEGLGKAVAGPSEANLFFDTLLVAAAFTLLPIPLPTLIVII